jgi:beta-mannanase
MQKKIVFYLLAALISAFAIFTVIPTRRHINEPKSDKLIEKASEPILGIYDRDEKITTDEARALRHFNIKWNSPGEDTSAGNKLGNILKEKQNLLLTIKMWSKQGEASSPHGILQGMVNGEYDNKIINLCKILSVTKNTVYLRWNPEMEVPVNQYQWQSQSSYLYINAFRHFALLCKKSAPDLKIVWGPLGYAGVLEYWPGADVVDFASITLNTLPPDLALKYPAETSIPVQIKRKLHRLRFIDKPVLIIGSVKVKKETFSDQWLDAAVQDIQKDTAIIYSSKNFTKPDNANSKVNPGFEIGVFDPQHQLAVEKAVTVEHLFANFGSLKNGLFKKDFFEVISRGHNVIVTMEFWKDENLEKDSNVLINTINGHYDPEIKELYDIICGVKQTVYLRWGHEMEIPIDRYPWQSKDPATYIKAFRYFMNFNKKAKNVFKVWGPTGDRGALDWWPGEDVVDYISLAIYGLPNKNITDHNRQETFSTIFSRKYNRMRFVNKPVLITEFGVKGPQSYKRKWLEDAAATINKNPQIVGVNYFNFTDSPKAWGDIEPPDWSITKETFDHFTSELNR